MRELIKRSAVSFAATAIIGCILTVGALAQSSGSKAPAGIKVTKVDLNGFKKAIKPDGRPLLINFWATWCDPCREEFPDLVKFQAEYRGKIDFVTISLDDLAEIDRDVPKFLREMKSDIPAFLLKVPDEGEAIKLVAQNWGGNLPLTVLLDADGKNIYQRNGKIKPDAVRAMLEGAISGLPNN